MNCFDAYTEGKYIKCCSFDELVKICRYLASKGIKWVDTDDIDENSINLFKGLEFPIWLVKDLKIGYLSWTDDLISKSGCNYIQNKIIKDDDIVSFCDLTL